MKSTYTFLFIITLILLSNIVYSQSVPSYVPTNGLVGWWGFNGNAQDGSGNGNHGTVNGATLTTDRFGNPNSAYNFDGVNDFINVADRQSLHCDSFTVLAWVRGNDFYGFKQVISKNYGNSIYESINFVLNNQSIWNITGQVGGNGYYGTLLTSPTIFPVEEWHQIGFSYTGVNSIQKLYLDGQIAASNVAFTTVEYDNMPLTFAAQFEAGTLDYFFNGKLDDIGIWNRALTPQEITNLYNSQLPTQTSLCLPTITTTSPSSVGVDTVVIGGIITNDGGSSIVLRGVCYSTSPNPNMGNLRTEDGSGIGSFNTVLRGLNPSTTYYARSYAKNSNGVVVYGNEVSFTTSVSLPGLRCPGTPTVTDIDGNIYNTVQIGNQCWTQSNLKVSKYRNGDTIPTGLSNSQWSSTTSGAYAIYNNDPVNDGLYGKLYNHYAVTDSRGLCPTGWHVPTDSEWNVLVKYLDPNADTVCANCWQSSIAGGSMKSTATQPTPGGWYAPNTDATNSSGFTGPPGGFRSSDGVFYDMSFNGWWWSSSVSSASVAWFRFLDYASSFIFRYDYYYLDLRPNGFSVRCLKD